MTTIPVSRVTQRKDRKVNLDFQCSSDRMTVLNLLGKGDSNPIKQSSDGSLRMPSHGFYRSKQPQQKSIPHAQRTHRRRVLPLAAMESQYSSVLNPKKSSKLHRISGHQIPYTRHHAEYSALSSAKQDSKVQSAADSFCTLMSSLSFNEDRPFSQPYKTKPYKTEPQASHHHTDTNTQSTRYSNPSIMELSEAEHEFQMKRQGSHFEAHAPTNSSISVTSALKSRAIAIHRSTTIQPEDVDELYAQESEKIYDQATWRMYNRIVDHRRNHQSDLSLATTQRQPSVVSDDYQTLNTLRALNNIHFDSLSIDNDDGAYSPGDDGEIFELDL